MWYNWCMNIHITYLWFTHWEAQIVKTLLCALISYLDKVRDWDIGPTRILFVGEDWLHLLGYTTSQTNSGLTVIDEVPLLDINIGVWCAVSATAVSLFVKPHTRLHIVHTFWHSYWKPLRLQENLRLCSKTIQQLAT
jgi:hypothetical protein